MPEGQRLCRQSEENQPGRFQKSIPVMVLQRVKSVEQHWRKLNGIPRPAQLIEADIFKKTSRQSPPELIPVHKSCPFLGIRFLYPLTDPAYDAGGFLEPGIRFHDARRSDAVGGSSAMACPNRNESIASTPWVIPPSSTVVGSATVAPAAIKRGK